jgi:hypothetical protein
MSAKPTPNSETNDGLPPFVSSWPQLYGFVVVSLVLTIVLFIVLKRYFQ